MLCFVNLGFCRFQQFSSPVCKGCRSAASEAAEQMEDYNLQAFCHHVVCFLKKPFLRWFEGAWLGCLFHGTSALNYFNHWGQYWPFVLCSDWVRHRWGQLLRLFCCFAMPAAASKPYEAKMVPVIQYLMRNRHLELPEGWPADWAPWDARALCSVGFMCFLWVSSAYLCLFQQTVVLFLEREKQACIIFKFSSMFVNFHQIYELFPTHYPNL